MTVKKILTLLLALCLLATILPGCNLGEPAETTAATKNPLDNPRHPANDDQLNLLFIGNSYSYYWPDELWGLLTAAGYENVTVCNVYYSGCTFQQHWEWYEKGEANYRFCVSDNNGENEYSGYDLHTCLYFRNWDVISFQQSGKYIYGRREDPMTDFRESIEPYLTNLYDLAHKAFPYATYYWLQSWAHELGNGVHTLEQQAYVTEVHRTVGKEVCDKYGFINVPCGDAWELVRHDPIIKADGKTLTTRIRNDDPMYDDLTHDGDHGGGQYLNACVWFEVLTGKSVIGNTFRPTYVLYDTEYPLSEEKISLLQNAAHTAVANFYGEDYAK